MLLSFKNSKLLLLHIHLQIYILKNSKQKFLFLLLVGIYYIFLILKNLKKFNGFGLQKISKIQMLFKIFFLRLCNKYI